MCIYSDVIQMWPHRHALRHGAHRHARLRPPTAALRTCPSATKASSSHCRPSALACRTRSIAQRAASRCLAAPVTRRACCTCGTPMGRRGEHLDARQVINGNLVAITAAAPGIPFLGRTRGLLATRTRGAGGVARSGEHMMQGRSSVALTTQRCSISVTAYLLLAAARVFLEDRPPRRLDRPRAAQAVLVRCVEVLPTLSLTSLLYVLLVLTALLGGLGALEGAHRLRLGALGLRTRHDGHAGAGQEGARRGRGTTRGWRRGVCRVRGRDSVLFMIRTRGARCCLFPGARRGGAWRRALRGRGTACGARRGGGWVPPASSTVEDGLAQTRAPPGAHL